uniref:Si:ch211-207e14.4 n=1 Tax=Poecilia latipinna TaxID=48699 RepID=A0A3B3TMK1_9TELE
CIPWPCLELLGDEDPSICEHYVQAPDDVKVEFVHDSNPKSDSVIVSWKPSHYIAFLRGFQVSVQALGGTAVACQLLLFSRNVSLSAAHAQTFYKSDPFPGLSLGSQYAVTVMALPVPEQWDKFYQSFYFKTRCAAKNGLEQCKQWYPQQVEVQQNGSVVIVTFNLAPPTVGIRRYFCVCSGDGEVKYTDIILDSLENKTHHSFQLSGLRKGTNYSCQPRLLICYSHYDGEAHVKAVMQLGAFIQQHMATQQVCLDLWDYLSIAEEGIMAWHCRQIRESDFVLVICSPGLRQRYDPEVTHSDSVDLMSNACSCSAIVQLIGEEVGRAKARGEDMSKYMAAVFKYCKETDIPTELRLASHYTLPHDLPLLFSHLQGVALHRPGSYLKINNITEEGYTGVPMGAALQLAI